MSISPPGALGLVLTSEHANIALRCDIREVGGLENQFYCPEPFFETLAMSHSPPAALGPVLTSQNAYIAL